MLIGDWRSPWAIGYSLCHCEGPAGGERARTQASLISGLQAEDTCQGRSPWYAFRGLALALEL